MHSSPVTLYILCMCASDPVYRRTSKCSRKAQQPKLGQKVDALMSSRVSVTELRMAEQDVKGNAVNGVKWSEMGGLCGYDQRSPVPASG